MSLWTGELREQNVGGKRGSDRALMYAESTGTQEDMEPESLQWLAR